MGDLKKNRKFLIILLSSIMLFLLTTSVLAANGIWSALNNGSQIGVNNYVYALAVDGNDLYAGGVFTTAGGVTANRIAKWDGSSWSALGQGLNGDVNALVVDTSGNLYAGGDFSNNVRGISYPVAKWDGNSWSEIGQGINGYVNALALDASGNLFAGGNFSEVSDVIVASNIAKWNGNSWSALISVGIAGVDSEVRSLAVDGSDLYVGGDFTTAGNVTVNHIAKWDINTNSWSALSSEGQIGVNNSVYALAVDGNDLYAGGVFTTAGGGIVNRIAKWDGTSWSTLNSGSQIGVDNSVNALAVDGNDLYAGGDFTTAGGVTVNRIAKWDGSTSSWSALGNGVTEEVKALLVSSSSDLYAGGFFQIASGETVDKIVNYIAKWTADNTPPSVSTSSPANGATIQSINTLTVDFSEDVLHNGSANAANNVDNYLLVEANSDGFQTTSVAAGVGGNDTEIAIISAVYENNGGAGPYQTTLSVVPLESGSYQLFVSGEASIHDIVGNSLNNGEDSVINFTVRAKEQEDPAQLEALPQTGFAPGVVTQLPIQGLSEMYQQYNFVSLEIPSLEVEAPIVGVPVSQDGWNLAWLGNQAGWLHGTAFPSWAGNSAITAHVFDANGQPGLFNNLNQLKWGDKVIVHAYGQAYVYEVRTVKKHVRPDDTSSVFEHEDYPWLTLITCRGYDEESDSYRWRVVVQAVQTTID